MQSLLYRIGSCDPPHGRSTAAFKQVVTVYRPRFEPIIRRTLRSVRATAASVVSARLGSVPLASYPSIGRKMHGPWAIRSASRLCC